VFEAFKRMNASLAYSPSLVCAEIQPIGIKQQKSPVLSPFFVSLAHLIHNTNKTPKTSEFWLI